MAQVYQTSPPYGRPEYARNGHGYSGGMQEEIDRIWAESRPAGGAKTTVGRNNPCPCGSGKKHKKCCGK